MLSFPVPVPYTPCDASTGRPASSPLCHQLDDATGLCDLAFGVLADVSGANDEGNLGAASLSEELRVAKG